ncbi:hypothetical protein JCM5296_000568 [Sporobolomyces johnsonii]
MFSTCPRCNKQVRSGRGWPKHLAHCPPLRVQGPPPPLPLEPPRPTIPSLASYNPSTSQAQPGRAAAPSAGHTPTPTPTPAGPSPPAQLASQRADPLPGGSGSRDEAGTGAAGEIAAAEGGEDLGGMGEQMFWDGFPGGQAGAVDADVEMAAGDQGSPRPVTPQPTPPPPHPSRSPTPASFPDHTLQIEYHPKTGFPPVTVVPTATNPHPSPFSIVPTLPHSARVAPPATPAFGPHPYSPFNTLADALLANPVFERGMSVTETKEHYALHFDSRIHPDPSPATPTTYKQVHSLIEQYTDNPFQPHTLTASHGNYAIATCYWQRDLRTMIARLVSNVDLAKFMRWGSEKWYVWQDGKRERVYGEVTSGKTAWELADNLGNGELAFLLVLFMDATNASSFAGHSTLYPVVWWPGTLSQCSRSRLQGSGAEVVALLPVPDYSGIPESAVKPLKLSIDSAARSILISSFTHLHRVGLVVADPLGLDRRIRPFLAHFSLDYQEAAKTFYLRQNQACVKCFEEKSTWDDLAAPMATLRTPESMAEAYSKIAGASKKERKRLRKLYGVHGDEQAGWASMLEGLDPYAGRTVDTLHENDSGNWADHLAPLLLEEVRRHLGKPGLARLDERYIAHTYYPGLRSLRSRKASKASFNDANTNRDLLKLAGIFYIDLLPPDYAPPCHSFIRALSLYRTILDSSAISETRLELLREQVQLIGTAASVSDVPTQDWYRSKPKSFQYPKFHAQKHTATTIENLGAPTHGDTRQGEGEHVVLKKLWRSTNRKEEDKQLVRKYTSALTMRDIMRNIELANPAATEDDQLVYLASAPSPPALLAPHPNSTYSTVTSFVSHLPLGYPTKGTFETRLRIFAFDWLQNDGATHSLASMPMKDYPSVATSPLIPCARLDLTFYSSADLSYKRAILRVDNKRNDAVLVQRGGNTMVGTLLGLFRFTFDDHPHPIALFRPFYFLQPRHPSRYTRLEPAPAADAVFVELRHVERPALIQEADIVVEDRKGKGKEGEQRVEQGFFLNDTVDLDLYDIMQTPLPPPRSNPFTTSPVALRSHRSALRRLPALALLRLFLVPPGTIALFVFSRIWIVDTLLEINQTVQSQPIASLNDAGKKKQDEDLFQVARLVNCEWFLQVVSQDYIRVILNVNRTESTWSLVPTNEIKSIVGGEVPLATGNAVSALYRWHAAISQKDTVWIEGLMRRDSQTGPRAGADENGRFRDSVRSISEATEEIAGAFEASGVPVAMRIVLGTQAARDDRTCTSLNEFRKFLNLTTYTTFERASLPSVW